MSLSASSRAQSKSACHFLNELTDTLRKHSIYKNRIDWTLFRKELLRRAHGTTTIVQCYPIAQYAVTKLNDRHSYFAPAIAVNESEEQKAPPILTDEVVPNNIGYIRLPYCMGDDLQTAAYISKLSNKIRDQNQQLLKGWIIDLRSNFGGNMWPMIAAISPLLNDGIQGYFWKPEGSFIPWRLQKGAAAIDTQVLAKSPQYFAVAGRSRIAVLINQQTASSGEAIAVVFKGQSNTKFFGSPTYGVSTGCESFQLSDGSRLNLATTIFADRNKVRYGNAILPDSYCPDTKAVASAIEWLLSTQ